MNEDIAIAPDDDDDDNDDDDDAAARPRRAQTHPRAVGDIPAGAVLVSPHTRPLVLRNRPLALKLRPLAVSDVATGVATVVTARSTRRQHPRTILGVGILRKRRKRMERVEVGRTARRRREGIAGCGDVASGPREGHRPRRHRRRRLPPPCCPSRLKSGRHWQRRRDSRHCRLSTQGILSSLSAFAWSSLVILSTVTTVVSTSKPTLTRVLSSFRPVCPWP